MANARLPDLLPSPELIDAPSRAINPAVAVYGFIALHFGAVAIHALAGDDARHHMFFLKRREPQQP
jgi:hypothetical protein